MRAAARTKAMVGLHYSILPVILSLLVSFGLLMASSIHSSRVIVIANAVLNFLATDVEAAQDTEGFQTNAMGSGTPWGWGYNYYGQLGNGIMISRTTPVQVSGLTGVLAIGGGYSHSMALKADGTVRAWGDNGSGQLGDGTTISKTTPVQVSGLTGVVAITGGYSHSMAMKADGTVWAWGDNSSGQLGDGTTISRTTPAQVGGLTGVVAIVGGSSHSIALKNDGTIWAWGNNYYAQLGDGTTISKTIPVQVSGLTGVVAIAGGDAHSIALKTDGTVWTWGGNFSGQLGDGTTFSRTTPVQVGGLMGVVAIAGGYAHSIALKTDGTVWAWGGNFSGQLGDGTVIDRSTPVQVSGLTGMVAIGGGYFHNKALKGDGTVWAWGYNFYGQLGDGTIVDRTTPVQASGLTDVMAIPGGYFHSLALKTDGTVWTWGDNGSGQLGIGESGISIVIPVQTHRLADASAIVGGDAHSIALKTDGTVWCWGYNFYGQLGDGTIVDRTAPVQVSGLADVTAIGGGNSHSIALKTDGTVWAWGYNGNGQLGDGTTVDRTTPVQVGGLTGVIAIAAGAYHSIALKTDGTVWTWGGNYSGQLGDGTIVDRTAPVQVSGLADVTAIGGGNSHSIALKTDGTVWTWGGNYSGQLGDGTIVDRTAPVQVSGLADVTAIGGGNSHSISLKTDGTVWSWGHNGYGQLGDGTTIDRTTPVQVSGLTGVVTIDGGGYHSISLKTDGTVWAWGYNGYGQLGDGTKSGRTTPVQVNGLTGVLAIAGGSYHSFAILPTTADIISPTGTVFINTDSAYTNSASVILALSCADSGTGCAQMKFSHDNVTYSSPAETYALIKAWTLDLTGGDGTKTVYVKFKDYADNWSDSYSDTITLETALPTTTAAATDYTFGSWTASGSVSVTLSASDGSGSGVAAGYPKYCTDAANTCMPNTVYTVPPAINCLSGSVCIQYARYYSKDNAYNVEAVQSAEIMQDRQVPTTSAIPAGGAYSGAQSITLSCNDLAGGGCGSTFYCLGAECTPAIPYGGAIPVVASTDLRYFSTDSVGNTESVKTSTYAINYVVSASVAGGNGAISCQSPVNSGASSVCTITPDSGYHLQRLTDNGASVPGYLVISGGSLTYAFANVTADHANIVATFAAYAGNGAINLRQSGQTTSYAVGDDGAVQDGVAWPDPRFSDNGDQTVTDNLTGLIWTKDAGTPTVGACPGGTGTWQQGLDYLACLNVNNYLGHNDWRLPNINELQSLIDSQQGINATWLNSQGFLNVQNYDYGSSTTRASSATSATYLFMGDGSVSGSDKASSCYAWPVRGGQTGNIDLSHPAKIWKTGQTASYDANSPQMDDGALQDGVTWPSPRFTDNSDGTVRDNLTGVIWLKDANCFGSAMSWNSALSSANTMADGQCGLTDGSAIGQWRLPNREELHSLLDMSTYNPTLPEGHPFVNVQSDSVSGYWTSTSYAANTAFGWMVGMRMGAIASRDKTVGYNVWLVKGGSGFSGNPGVSSAPSSKDFGTIDPGSLSFAQTFTITNTGTNNLYINTITTSGTNAGEFRIQNDTCSSYAIAPAGTCTLQGVFSPTSAGPKSAGLSIPSNAPLSPTTVALSGTGASVCGNGTVEVGEQCDDSNVIPGDGCSAACTIESGYSCNGSPTVCSPVCGDGIIRGAEQCDDGNASVGDGCANSCAVESGWNCSGTPSVCTSICGDGMTRGTEQCDDNDTMAGDGCSATCTIEGGWGCSGTPSVCGAICGDSIVRGAEQCDDGNTTASDGCSATCTIESGWNCSGAPSVCNLNAFAISFSSTGSGAMTCNTVSVTPGGSFQCDVIPASGNYLESLIDNLVNVTSQVSNDQYTVTNVTADHALSATFHQNLPVLRLTGGNESWFTGIQTAYNTCAGADNILTWASDFYESLDLNRNIALTIYGGMDTDFQFIIGMTTIHGSMTVGPGPVSVRNLTIQFAQ